MIEPINLTVEIELERFEKSDYPFKHGSLPKRLTFPRFLNEVMEGGTS